jgi:hypothetical protein
MKNKRKALGLAIILSFVAVSVCMFQVQAGGGVTGPANSNTFTYLNAISSPLFTGQTDVVFSGTVNSESPINYPVPSGGSVQLFYSSSISGPWTQVATATISSDKTPTGMVFTGTFNVPSGIPAGTYYFKAQYLGATDAIGNTWSSSTSLSVSQDNVHVEVRASVFPLPEYAFGALGALGACLVGVVVFKLRGKIFKL